MKPPELQSSKVYIPEPLVDLLEAHGFAHVTDDYPSPVHRILPFALTNRSSKCAGYPLLLAPAGGHGGPRRSGSRPSHGPRVTWYPATAGTKHKEPGENG